MAKAISVETAALDLDVTLPPGSSRISKQAIRGRTVSPAILWLDEIDKAFQHCVQRSQHRHRGTPGFSGPS